MFIFHYGNHIISFLAGCSPAADKETLQKLQITHIVNLASLFGNRFPESFTYLKIEMEDSDDVDIKQPIYRVLRFIESTLTLGGRVLIHCNAGVSRAGAMVTAYVMKTKGCKLKDALKFVRSKRRNNPVTPNDGFLRDLKKFEKQLVAVKVIKTT